MCASRGNTRKWFSMLTCIVTPPSANVDNWRNDIQGVSPNYKSLQSIFLVNYNTFATGDNRQSFTEHEFCLPNFRMEVVMYICLKYDRPCVWIKNWTQKTKYVGWFEVFSHFLQSHCTETNKVYKAMTFRRKPSDDIQHIL